MKLEQAIEQYHFSSEHLKLLINLQYTHNWAISKIKDFLSQFDLTVQQFNVLRIIRGQRPNPTTINLLRERMLDKMSDASRVVERLRQKGLIQRQKSEVDRRSVEVKITDEGLRVLERVDSQYAFLDNLLSNISAEQARYMNEYLDQIRGDEQ